MRKARNLVAAIFFMLAPILGVQAFDMVKAYAHSGNLSANCVEGVVFHYKHFSQLTPIDSLVTVKGAKISDIYNPDAKPAVVGDGDLVLVGPNNLKNLGSIVATATADWFADNVQAHAEPISVQLNCGEVPVVPPLTGDHSSSFPTCQDVIAAHDQHTSMTFDLIFSTGNGTTTTHMQLFISEQDHEPLYDEQVAANQTRTVKIPIGPGQTVQPVLVQDGNVVPHIPPATAPTLAECLPKSPTPQPKCGQYGGGDCSNPTTPTPEVKHNTPTAPAGQLPFTGPRKYLGLTIHQWFLVGLCTIGFGILFLAGASFGNKDRLRYMQ
ncbi:MAG: hypothetical protein JWS12_629 [Candidatus Saccharibacteria bacterium]|nr:hypothetical protein [Candidatus Saccharibacteria bacterium]